MQYLKGSPKDYPFGYGQARAGRLAKKRFVPRARQRGSLQQGRIFMKKLAFEQKNFQ